LHRAWSVTHEGQAVTKGENHQWEQAPSDQEIECITSKILDLVDALNKARRHGFICEVVNRKPHP
jgi:hypothetical protein